MSFTPEPASAPPPRRTLLVTRNLPPLVGGMERLNLHIALALANHGEVAIIGPSGARAHLPAALSVNEVPHRPMSRFLVSAWGASRRQRHFAPTHVLAGSGLTAPMARHAARRSGARFSVYVHGLDLVVDHPVYRRLWLPVIRSADQVIANSRNTAQLARDRGIAAERIRIVTPGTDVFGADLGPQRTDGRAAPVLLSVGRLTERKGLTRFVQDVMPELVRKYPRLELVVVGEDAIDAAAGFRASERERILEAAGRAGVEANLRMTGGVDEPSLDALYRSADMHVFPVRALPGDVEGFGMVALEAAARGIPTLGYAVGGVPDAVDTGQTGELVPADDSGALTEAICRWLQRDRTQIRDACLSFAERNSWAVFERRLLDALA